MPPDELRRQVIDLLADQAFLDEEQAMPCTEEQYRARLGNATERINMAAQDVARLLPKLLESFHKARLAIEQQQAPHWADVRQDITVQLSALMQRDFLSQTPWRWLQEFPRTLAGHRASIGSTDARIPPARPGRTGRDRTMVAAVR